ncbi:hypothetical protein [Arsenophonus nasoniae]|uniref:Uncharacterized protein n=1 Tax=Arsenophonus nasoniae TaxID=638 RepID=A0ABY8NZA2_9GAMM|nr:hypothetical protein [Arsenophonus nasoniae]WGM09039.1 hypothetical protein QE258_27165 [Arsenophonus nasoniae]
MKRNGFDDFFKLTNLDIYINSNENLEKKCIGAKIYANGLNQLHICIVFSAVNKKNEPLKVSINDVIDSIYLCDESGVDVPLFIIYNDKEDDFAIAAEYEYSEKDKLNDQDELLIHLYIRSFNSIALKLCAGINIPGIGKYNTTKNGTSTKNGNNGDVFKNYKFINFKAVPPIKYDKRNDFNIEIKSTVLTSKLGWTERFSVAGPYYEHFDGKLTKKQINITPKTEYRTKNVFKRHDVKFYFLSRHHSDVINVKYILDDDLNGGNIKFGTDTGEEPCFYCLQIPLGSGKLPNWITSKRINKSYNLNFYFSFEDDRYRSNDVLITGPFFLASKSYYYRCSSYAKDKIRKENAQSIELFCYCFDFNVDAETCAPYQWDRSYIEDAPYFAKVQIVDLFGNKNDGYIKINNKDDSFDFLSKL